MALATQTRGPNTVGAADGSRTMTILDVQPRPSGSNDDPEGSTTNAEVGVLSLRGGRRRDRRHVVWDDDVVDNEGQGKKKSKICCIYHKPKAFDESSSEESSDSDSDCDRHHHHRPPLDRAAPARRQSAGRGEGATRDRHGGDGVIHELQDDSEPNAYEAAPSKKGKRKAT
ncbi:hypothetical protein HWV62_17992 [Athelia sp. TMB]|nr:hypothetical protein HWV62_17992 [Athelia sp. TMB]